MVAVWLFCYLYSILNYKFSCVPSGITYTAQRGGAKSNGNMSASLCFDINPLVL
jgi:hypothetical protein